MMAEPQGARHSAVVDFHNHLIPGVDDGAQTLEDACAALSAFAREGVGTIITTPHLSASLTLSESLLAERMEAIDQAWQMLQEHARSHHADLVLKRGVELALDTPEPRVSDERLRLAGGAFTLVEFPYMTVPPRSAAVIADLRSRDMLPILAHPERYVGGPDDTRLPEQWRHAGAFLQVNGASLLGRYGPVARRRAFRLLERGLVDFLSSDYHARGTPATQEYRALLLELEGAEQVELLTETNPARILRNEPPLPVPPFVVRRSLWERVTEMFRTA